MGYVMVVWKNTGNEDGKILVTGLLKEQYEAAFLANARNINSDTQAFLTEYVLRISMKEGSDAEVETIMNAALKQWNEDVSGSLRSNSNSMKYVEMIYTGMVNFLNLESIYFWDTESLSEDGLAELLKRNEKQMALATMSGSMYEILYEAMGKGGGYLRSFNIELSEIKVGSLNYNKGTKAYVYDISYQGWSISYSVAGEKDRTEINGSKSVTTRILETPGEAGSQIYQEAREALAKAQEEQSQKLFEAILKVGTMSTLKATNPLGGAAAELFLSAVDGDKKSGVKSIQSVIKSGANPDGKVAAVFKSEASGISVSIIQAWIGYQNNCGKLTGQLKTLDKNQELVWFGQGGTYQVKVSQDEKKSSQMVVSGIYNPNMIMRLAIWEKEGIEGLAKRTTGEKMFQNKDLKYDEAQEKFFDKLTEEQIDLWNGKGILDMDIIDLQNAFDDFSEAYQEVNGGQGITFSTLFDVWGKLE